MKSVISLKIGSVQIAPDAFASEGTPGPKVEGVDLKIEIDMTSDELGAYLKGVANAFTSMLGGMKAPPATETPATTEPCPKCSGHDVGCPNG